MYPTSKGLTTVGFPFGAIYTLPQWFKKGAVHKGVDIKPLYKMPANPLINSSVSGQVIYSGLHKPTDSEYGFGLYVIVLFLDKSASLIEDRIQMHYFAHLLNVTVDAGDMVTKGSTLGVMGDSGWATGVHLHYAVKVPIGKRGEFIWIDPTKFMT